MSQYTMEDWLQMERELTRERGLWGPPVGSDLDKWMLDMTEGFLSYHILSSFTMIIIIIINNVVSLSHGIAPCPHLTALCHFLHVIML